MVGGNYVCGVDNNNKMPVPKEGRTIIATFYIDEYGVDKDVQIKKDSKCSDENTSTSIKSICIRKLGDNNENKVECIDCGNEDGGDAKNHKFSSEGRYEIYYFFKEGVTIADMSYMFSWCDFLTSLDLSNFDTKDVKNMNDMCKSCNNLQSVEFGDIFNTGNVTNMSEMFYGCSSLKTLDLSKFNTINVEDMSQMFYGCSNLTDLNFSKFNTNSVENMSGMFRGCSSLTSLNISNFKTENVTDMSNMFRGCSALTELNLSNFYANSVEDMSWMFVGCTSLKILNLSNFKTDSVNSKSYLFEDCLSLETVISSDVFINECSKSIIDENKKVKSGKNEEKNLEGQSNQNLLNESNREYDFSNQNDQNKSKKFENKNFSKEPIVIVDNQNFLNDGSQAKSESKCCCCPCC